MLLLLDVVWCCLLDVLYVVVGCCWLRAADEEAFSFTIPILWHIAAVVGVVL